MKQGTANNTAGGKTEPSGRTVSPEAVSRIGNVQIPGTANIPLFMGPGVQAPPAALTVHPKGSQGKHK